MTSRLLPRDEWLRLEGTELERVWPYLPTGARVLVVEDAGVIVGCWSFFPLIHAEGLWIAPSHRASPAVGRRLLTGMRRHAAAMGARAINTAAQTDAVAAMLERAGAVELVARHFALRVGDLCQQP